ncbi:MAG: DNA methyltransferase [Pseudonocardiaceae bacterium]
MAAVTAFSGLSDPNRALVEGYITRSELLERIIAASSREGDLMLDPFCGCGMSIEATQRLTVSGLV